MTLELVFLGAAFLGILIASRTWSMPQVHFPVVAGLDEVDRGPSADLQSRRTLLVLALFLLATGVIGYVLFRFANTDTFLAMPTAVAAGVFSASWAKRLPAKREDEPLRRNLAGTVGRLTLPIREGGEGEMVVSKGRRVRHVPVTSQDGQPISKGEEVMVVAQHADLVFVRRLDPMLSVVESAIGRRESRE